MTAEEEPGPRLYDVDLEQALLGAMLTDEAAIARASSICDPDDFFDPMHQRLAVFMFKQHADGKAVTPLTVGSGMAHDAGLAELAKLSKASNPRAYLISLARAAPPNANVEDYSRILGELRAKRDAVDAMEYAKEVFSGDGSVADALSPLIHVFDTAQARGQAPEDSRQIGDAANALLREAEEAERSGKVLSAPTGIDALDDLIGGLAPEFLIVIGGRPGMGKSILGTTICRAVATCPGGDFVPMLFSLEMGGREVAARMIADADYDAAVAAGKRGLAYSDLLHHRRMSDEEWARAFAAQQWLSSIPLEVNDRGRLTFPQIAGLCRARAARTGKRVVPIIDHLQIIEATSRRRERNRNDEISEITGSAKQLAKRIACPVILLSQLGRDVEKREDKHPMLSDFRDSGSIEQDADVLLSVYRPAYYAGIALRHAKTAEAKTNAESVALKTKNVLEIEALKNRSGPTRSIEAWIDVRSSVIRGSDPVKTGPETGDLLALAKGV